MGVSMEDQDDLTKKLNAIAKKIEVNKTVDVLDSLIKGLKDINVKEESKSEKVEQTDETLMNQCRSMNDIVTKFSEYEYKEAGECVVCNVCSTKFGYKGSLGTDFTEKGILPSCFRDLKKSLKRHLESHTHKTA